MFDSKLEAFLKRNLDVETFEKVRTHEPCIVCSDSEDKVFKFVILTDERIFITENPPKSISVDRSVLLKDVNQVAILNEYPDFLNGEERENTVHIVVKYKADEAKSKRLSSNDTPDSSSINHSTLTSLKSSRSLPAFHSSSADCDQVFLDSNILTIESDILVKSLDERLFREYKKNVKKIHSTSSSPKKVKNKKMKRKLPELNALDNNGNLMKALQHIENNNTIEAASLYPPLSNRSRNNSINSSKSIAASDLSDATTSLNGYEGNRKRVTKTLHLYMPKHNSTLFGMLRNAWKSSLIKSTLEEDEYHKKNLIYSLNSPKVTSQTLETLYCELKNDIFDERATMEELFYLIIELKNAVERKFMIKKLFWKSQDMFGFIIEQLKLYIPCPHKQSHEQQQQQPSDGLKSKRADQLEYAILLADTLHIMLMDSDVFTTRIFVLQSEGGRYLRDLVTLMVSTPSLPVKHIPPSAKVQLMLNSFDLNRQMMMRDEELTELDQSFNNSCVTILCELLIISRQVIWYDTKQDFLTYSWYMNYLQSLNNMNSFIEKSLKHAIQLISPSRYESLRASEAVLLYRLFTFILTLVEQSNKRTVQFVRSTFLEEFKYYIQAPVIRKKIPYSYTIRPFTLKIMEEVMQIVLQRKVILVDV